MWGYGELNLTAFQSAYFTSFGEKKMLVLHSQGGEYITDQLCARAPSTPERDREDEYARQHAAALQMTSLSGSHAPSHGNPRPSGSRPSLDWPRFPFSSERPFIVQPDLPRGSHPTCPESEDVISLCSHFWSQPRLLYDHSIRPYVLFQNLAFVLF